MVTDKGVTETKPGNMPKAGEQAVASSTDKGKIPGAAEVSPEAPKSYSQEEVEKLLHTFKSESGREKKELEVRVTTLEKQLTSKTDELTENTAEIEKLEARIDDLSKDDPERITANRELKIAKEERKQLKADREALEGERATHAESIKIAYDTLREISVWTIAEEYDNGDAVKLKDLCDTFEIKSEEQIRKAADKLWTKKTIEPAKPSAPPLKLFSGVTQGGGPQTDEERLKSRYPKMVGK